MQPTRKLERATLRRFPIWFCTGWGLPSFSGHPKNWCALTAPFHPYLASNGNSSDARRFTFCCTCLRVTATPRYGASCPMVFGLSSSRVKQPAIVWATPTHILNISLDTSSFKVMAELIGCVFTFARRPFHTCVTVR